MAPLKTLLLQNVVASPLHTHNMEEVVNVNSNVIENRLVDINNLERGVREVGELFTDISLLVQEQGEHIDNIETNIQGSNINIDKARQQLVRANQYRVRRRRCYIKCICFTIVLLICIIILLIITSPKN
jgi:t-SNARE complex subunit (syntaxin)